MPINSGKGSLSLNLAENQPNHKAVQAEINIMNVSDSVHYFRDTNDLRVREEIDIFEKQISNKFSDILYYTVFYTIVARSPLSRNSASGIPLKTKIIKLRKTCCADWYTFGRWQGLVFHVPIGYVWV